MRSKSLIFTIILLSATIYTYGQSQCACNRDSLWTANINCDTTYLKDHSFLYYQFNCDSSWLTIENKTGKKKVLCSIDYELSGYTYRLGFRLIKEYQKYLLFRYGCPANGPCYHVLLNKTSWKETQHFNEIIYSNENSGKGFIIYFSNNKLSSLTIHFIDSNKKYFINIPGNRFHNNLIPESQFNEGVIKNKLLLLPYEYKDSSDKWLKDEIKIDLSKYLPAIVGR